MLWGPSQSGKTLLIWGFARDIEKQSLINEQFSYSLQRIFRTNPVDEPKKIPVMDIIRAKTKFPDGDQNLSDKEYEFRRIPKPGTGLTRKQMENHNFLHQIFIRDIKGGESTKFFDDPSMLAIQEAYIDSRNIISLFDIKFASDSDSQKYISDFRKLIRFLTDNHPFGKKQRNLAICLSKIDQHVFNANPNPELILKMLFSPEFVDYIKEENVRNEKLNIGLFATSAVGSYYDPHKGEVTSNINKEKDYFQQNGSSWSPFNAADPFFWIFESLEREIFSNNRGLFDNYIPYK